MKIAARAGDEGTTSMDGSRYGSVLPVRAFLTSIRRADKIRRISSPQEARPL